MKNKLRHVFAVVSALILSSTTAHATVSFDWAVIGNAGNAADAQTGYGAVAYDYSIATTEVTNAQYVEFLNAVATTDTYGLYNSEMGSTYGGITQNGSPGSYSYSLKNNDTNWANRPVVYVSWYDTLRFTNWLHNGQLTGAQNASTTEDGAYTFSGATSVSTRNSGAEYWLPSEDEWYKAAYYSLGGVYYDYATGTDSPPNNNAPGSDTGNSANYYGGGYVLGSPYYSTEVGAYDESESAYGTYDQNGNVWEWNEALIGSNRGARGGSWLHNANYLPSSNRSGYGVPTSGIYYLGFRVASSFTGDEGGAVPEPASVGLVLLSVGGLVLRRAKRA